MNEAERVDVNYPGGSYPIIFRHDAYRELRSLTQLNAAPYVVVSDENVAPLYAAHFSDCLDRIVVPAGETYKTLATVHTLYRRMLAAGLDRSGVVVALGGGVIGDMAGFAAASYMRGIALVQCPTSLLAMVDASIGGKTGVDLVEGKNLVGAFKQPQAVLIDTQTLSTLPPEQFAAGMAEVIKAALIDDPALFARLEASAAQPTQLDDLQPIIAAAIDVKRRIVEQDPFEKGVRALLNLGHTFGHAIEQSSRYQILHGAGVAIGTVIAVRLSAELGYCAPTLSDRVERVLQAHALPTTIPAYLTVDQIMLAMGSDKKKRSGKLHYILIRDVGDCFISADVEPQRIAQLLRQLGAAGA